MNPSGALSRATLALHEVPIGVMGMALAKGPCAIAISYAAYGFKHKKAYRK